MRRADHRKHEPLEPHSSPGRIVSLGMHASAYRPIIHHHYSISLLPGHQSEDPGSLTRVSKALPTSNAFTDVTGYHFRQGNASAVQRVLLPSGSHATLLSWALSHVVKRPP